MKVELGSEVTDSITGLAGIVTARTVYLTGCAVIQVTPKVKKDGTHQDSHWFDEPRLVVKKEAVVGAMMGG